MHRPPRPFPPVAIQLWKIAAFSIALVGLVLCATGCGTTREYNATQQLVMSDAVDRSIASIDFRPLSGQRVYLDTSYMRQIKGESFVNADYVTSSLRQQIVGAGCFIQDASTDADIIIEARIGTLGSDDHRVTFGIPENNALATAASLVPGAPQVSSVPEIAFARREAREAAAKVAAFAYDRETRAPIWQSGVKPAMATARDTWVMGVGPFQAGSIRRRTKLAGSGLKFGATPTTGSPARFFDRPPVDYTAVTRFQEGWPVLDQGGPGADLMGHGEWIDVALEEPVQIADRAPDVAPSPSEAPPDGQSYSASADGSTIR
ncbi:hypothetical protein Poly51_38070 [Rubripirellula tenax]|uniref:Uncharacterized protein n=1 Tax=Rubripirellula tenax TaxID=2528015 RepID=A0A5C6ER22_9BACT|nr:DUF6655 family protein [Rubripirellula tenax]TWU50517.1 hypothetical protein Poly51_38070 [Rubripirellula tenax]